MIRLYSLLILVFCFLSSSIVFLPYELPLKFLLYVVVFVVNGTLFFLMNHIQHEICHFNFGKKHSEFLSHLLVTYPIGVSPSYRGYHNDHHRFLGQEKDPDFAVYGNFPRSKSELRNKILFEFSGLGAIKAFFGRQNQKSKKNGQDSREFIFLVLMQLTLLVLFYFYTENVFSYFLFWLLPIFTVTKGLSFIRTFVEHACPQKGWAIRNFKNKGLFNKILGSFGFTLHAEHHIYPTVEYSSLRIEDNTNKMIKKFGENYEQGEYDYLGLLVKWYRDLPKVSK